MRRTALCSLCIALSFSAFAIAQNQTPPPHDPQALTVLKQAIANMGGSAPGDSTASGTISTTAGGSTENGAIVVLTRGTDQTSEQIQTADGSTSVYSQGSASQVQGGKVKPLPLERAVTAQSADFPLPLFVGMLNDSDSAYVYVGLETLNGTSAHHVQLWNSFVSTPKLSALAAFSVRDIWINASSSLPVRISYADHFGEGSSGSVAFDVTLSNYATFSGIQYPLSIQKSVNGTPWATIKINSVVFNTGLTDANFPVN